MIFQDPMTSLNPVLTIGKQVSEPLMLHLGMTKKEAEERVIELLQLVGIPEAEKRLSQYPHQFSGGMRQRVMIAMALACNPQILIADEPTTALDVTIQAQIIDLVKKLRDEIGMSVIWITHDLGVVAGLAQRVHRDVCRLYHRRSAGQGAVYQSDPSLYLGLLHSLPRLDSGERTQLDGSSPACPLSCWKNRWPVHSRRAAHMRLTAARKTPPCWTFDVNHQVCLLVGCQGRETAQCLMSTTAPAAGR